MTTYGIFFQLEGPTRTACQCCDRSLSRWQIVRNKRIALKLGKQAHAIVGAMPNQTRHDTWDAPTYRACMTVIADFSR